MSAKKAKERAIPSIKIDTPPDLIFLLESSSGLRECCRILNFLNWGAGQRDQLSKDEIDQDDTLRYIQVYLVDYLFKLTSDASVPKISKIPGDLSDTFLMYETEWLIMLYTSAFDRCFYGEVTFDSEIRSKAVRMRNSIIQIILRHATQFK